MERIFGKYYFYVYFKCWGVGKDWFLEMVFVCDEIICFWINVKILKVVFIFLKISDVIVF